MHDPLGCQGVYYKKGAPGTSNGSKRPRGQREVYQMASEWNKPCSPEQLWVCGACGRTTRPGGARDELRDSSCMCNAVLCWTRKNEDGSWQAVPEKKP